MNIIVHLLPVHPTSSNVQMISVYLQYGYATKTMIAPTTQMKNRIVVVDLAVHNISGAIQADVFLILGCATEIPIVRKTKTNQKLVVTRIIILANQAISNARIINVFQVDGDVIMKEIVGTDLMKKVSYKIKVARNI